MGTEEKKSHQYPKETEKMGTGAEKMTPVPKGNRENGYRREKMTLVPKGKKENGYRREKMTLVPKRNSSLPQKALRVDIFPKERYNSWKKAPMEESSHGGKLPWKENTIRGGPPEAVMDLFEYMRQKIIWRRSLR